MAQLIHDVRAWGPGGHRDVSWAGSTTARYRRTPRSRRRGWSRDTSMTRRAAPTCWATWSTASGGPISRTYTIDAAATFRSIGPSPFVARTGRLNANLLEPGL